MKRIIAIVLFALMICACFASCAKEFTCDMCGQTVKSKEHKEEIMGETISMCDSCYDGWKALGSLLG